MWEGIKGGGVGWGAPSLHDKTKLSPVGSRVELWGRFPTPSKHQRLTLISETQKYVSGHVNHSWTLFLAGLKHCPHLPVYLVPVYLFLSWLVWTFLKNKYTGIPKGGDSVDLVSSGLGGVQCGGVGKTWDCGGILARSTKNITDGIWYRPDQRNRPPRKIWANRAPGFSHYLE